MSPIQFTTSMVLVLYLFAFFSGSFLAGRMTGQSVWLFGTATGRDRIAAVGFRMSFALALAGPLLWVAIPALAQLDPLWRGTPLWSAVPGVLLAVAGAMLAFAAQIGMGASWRVGVHAGSVGNLVTSGLHAVSRNPTFLGQAALLLGVALAQPSLPGAAAVALFLASAHIQILSEEAVLKQLHGADFDAYAARVPRWIGRTG